MVRSALTIWVLVMASTLSPPARADSWPGPQLREVFSQSRDYFVRVTPGESWGDTFGFKGAKTGRYATAEFYTRRTDGSYELTAKATLLNPVAPVEFFVSDGGRLITIDNWHNRGYGVVVAIYTADGSVVKSYKLADLFTADEIEAFSHSISSIHWHDGPVYINADQKTLYMMVKSGDDLVLGLESGRYAYCRSRGPSYLCRDSKDDRNWRAHGDVTPAR
jgi:hypothetical protein